MAPPAHAPKSAAQPQSFAALPAAAKGGILVGLVALISAIYFFALHQPLSDEIDQAVQQHARLETDMTHARERQQEYIDLREELASREGLDRANLRVLPEDAEIASFLQDLNRLAETSGLGMRLVQPRPEEPETQYIRLPVSLHVAGRYHQLARFMYNVSRLERAISLEDISLMNPHVSGEDIIIDVQVLATTFRRPNADDPPPPPSPATGG